MAILGLGLQAVSEVWATSARRQRMAELEWIGAQFTQAIGSYFEATAGVVVKTYPRSLNDLLHDQRYPTMTRHLRQIYLNPFTARADWQFILAPDGGIRGVRIPVPGDAGPVWREFVYLRASPGGRQVGGIPAP